ncbi:uncharacterized protein LOC110632542 isoform X2 [Hevea brasiliensis]|uniref:uncharacterized protein LOC110632542 isoform X2 n=1 Tax=Hevea brasiliensis TaxID=3981 RepID=UPI000B78BD07|nr:uncharacterized protein LOC110632542 isoform X2 [Hevea brasiliensis]
MKQSVQAQNWTDTDSWMLLSQIRVFQRVSGQVTGDGNTISEVIPSFEDQEGNQNRKNSSNQRDMTLKRIFLITNFVVELPSAVFDQLSSVRKPQYALISMILSFTVMLISIIDLARTGRSERVKFMMRGHITWFYSPFPSYKPLGTFADIVGLVCGIFQCVFAAIAYAFLSHKAEGPIKISVWPLIFASGVLWSRFPWNTKAPVTRAVIKGPLHCWQCAKKLKRTILKNEGVQEVRVDMQKDTLTVKGTMDGKALVEFLQKKSGRRFEILPTEEEED